MEGRTYRFFRGKPLYPFGHGLSYTSFTYENIRAVDEPHGNTADEMRIALEVHNVGDRSGEEVVQVYVRVPGSTIARPNLELRGFARVALNAGDRATVTISLPRRAFEYYDGESKSWEVEPGTYEVLVGASSEDIRGKVELSHAGKNGWRR
jgi:beta-glucosidase